jgi:transcriptional regulator with XRE-family HTH domain
MVPTRRRGHPLLERKTVLAAYLTGLRNKVSLTQDIAGKKIGKDKSFICRLERGTKTPPPHILRALAGIYDVPPDELLRKAGYKEMPLLNMIQRPEDAPDTILDSATDYERRELKRYLAFIRIVKS